MRRDSEFLHPSRRLSFLWGFVGRSELLAAVSRFALGSSGRLLDVGCGVQPYRPLFRQVSEYVGVDVLASPHPFGNGVVIYDGKTLPFRDGSFDSCIATEVLEHARDPGAMMREIHRVLRPGGRLLVTVPFLFPVHEAPHDFWRFTRFGLEALATQAGFQEVAVMPLGGYHAAVAHLLGIYAVHRLNRWFLRPWCHPLVWLLQRALLFADRLDSRPRDELTLGWAMEARR